MEAMTEKTLDKTALRDFAVNARKKLKERIELQANLMGFYEDNRQVNYEFEDDNFFKINGETFSKKQAQKLREQITKKSFATVIDEVAYTWFNRFIALYYMEVNGYSENNCNIISNLSNISQYAVSIASLLSDEEKQSIIENINNSKEEPIFKTLIIHQCNVMNKKLPFLFEEIEDYTELLFPSGLLNNVSVIREMLAIDKSNWQVVEIIGWLYQYYIAERKDEVFANLKKGKKISKEDIPAATQIFTPKWIVKYMVENSVGKMWLEAHPNPELQSKFKYHLESAEQDEEVKQKLNEIINKNISPEDIKVLDPACGSGHILVTAFEVLYEIYKSAGYMEDDIASLILTKNLYGLDICDRAAQLAQLAVIMKAREYDKNISNKVTELNITSIQESNWMSNPKVKECLMNGVDNQLLAQSQIELLQTTFNDAKEYGSILEVKDFDFEFWNERLTAIQSLYMGLFYSKSIVDLQENLPKLVKQAKIMQQKYECVIANPPYMGNKGMSSNLSEFAKKKYPMSKGDMFAIFQEVILNHTKKNCYSSTVNQHSWMFLSSYEQLREYLLNNAVIDTMAHLGTRAFEELAGEVVQTTTYVTRKLNEPNYIGKFVKLTDYPNAKLKEEKFLEFNSNDIYTCKQNGFHSIPGSPIAYWASDRVLKLFSLKKIESKVLFRQGMATSDNERFLKLWQEVDISKVSFDSFDIDSAKTSKMKWFPYNKGGAYRKWYGNCEYFVNWENDGAEMKEYTSKLPQGMNVRLKSREYYFKECYSWSKISSGNISFRYYPRGFAFDVAGCCVFDCGNFLKYYLGLSNSIITRNIAKLLSPTMNFELDHLKKIPIAYPINNKSIVQINCLVDQNIQISKDDWDSFETSWDFQVHPLLRFKENGKVSDSFKKWNEYKQKQFNKLKVNEEELNKLFIEIYGLQDEMTPDVDDKDITVALADETREIKSLMSYAVGCMLGRYSLDEKGLAFAGGEFDSSKYKTLEVDEDGILPILSDTWFEDDIVEEFKRFLKKAFGELYFNENMQYIADVLGRKGSESAEDRIRTYYLKDFYKDHLQTYKKRPIYWMFTSGKEKAFNCLMYLHRYDKTTLSRIRKDYLHEYQAKLDRAKAQAEDEGNVKLNSLYSKYQSEILEYDRNLQVLADSQIELDLDDGVKVNYAKFKGLLEAEKDIAGRGK